jgi:hypothetical protein
VDDVVTAYFVAWNEPDPERRREILQRSLTDDAELLDPTGRWQGIDGFVDGSAPTKPQRPAPKSCPQAESTRTTMSSATPGRSWMQTDRT